MWRGNVWVALWPHTSITVHIILVMVWWQCWNKRTFFSSTAFLRFLSRRQFCMCVFWKMRVNSTFNLCEEVWGRWTQKEDIIVIFFWHQTEISNYWCTWLIPHEYFWGGSCRCTGPFSSSRQPVTKKNYVSESQVDRFNFLVCSFDDLTWHKNYWSWSTVQKWNWETVIIKRLCFKRCGNNYYKKGVYRTSHRCDVPSSGF